MGRKNDDALASVTVTAEQLKPELEIAIKADVVAYVTSSPGLGKSQIVASIAKEHNLKLIDIRLSTAQPEDLHGYPSKTINPETGEQEAEFIPFKTFPTASKKLPINPETNLPYAGWLILFDELSSASKPLQAAAYKVMLDKQVGEHDLHPMVRMVAAGNRSIDNSVVIEMSKALASRLTHFELRHDVKSWLDWAYDHNINSRIISYINSANGALNVFVPDSKERTFPCPRTWQMLSKVLNASPETITDIPLHRIGSVIGNEGAAAFLDYCRYYLELPTFQSVVSDPKGANVPSHHAKRFAMSDMLASNNALTPDTIKPIITYMRRLPVDMQANFSMLASKINESLTSADDEPPTPLEELASSVINVTMPAN